MKKTNYNKGEMSMANEIVKKLGMKSDIVFKAFFSREENRNFLEEFISAVLEKQIKVKNVVHDARLEQLAKEDKYGVLDLDVEQHIIQVKR